MRRAICFGIFGLLIAAFLAGCATYGKHIQEPLHCVCSGNYPAAREALEKELDPGGVDRLLYYMELGTVDHLGREFESSNRRFEEAERIGDDLYTIRMHEILKSMLTNPRNSDYAGLAFERIYINYYKLLNYLMLSQAARNDSKRAQYLEDTRAEAKRLDFRLSALELEKGSYKELRDSRKRTFVQLLQIFNKFRGKWRDEGWLVFREDALAQYLAGMVYEMNGQYDDARISYQKAAELYEGGYVEQYQLDGSMTEQAWFDTVRMMIASGGYENERRRLSEEKLSPDMRSRLKSYDQNPSEIVVIEHLGKIPQRKELNLVLRVLPGKESLILTPIPTGKGQEAIDQLSWFFLLYADNAPLDLLKNYAIGGLGQMIQGVIQKTIWLGPAWELAEELHIPQAIGREGVRVTVPYYPPIGDPPGDSLVDVDGRDRGSLIRAESLAQLALQNQLLNAGSDLTQALARAAIKNVLAAEGVRAVAEEVSDNKLIHGLIRLAGKGVATTTSAAETRNWLTLPREVRIIRIPVSPGRHKVALKLHTGSSCHTIKTHSFKLEPGEMRVWVQRTFRP